MNGEGDGWRAVGVLLSEGILRDKVDRAPEIWWASGFFDQGPRPEARFQA